MPHLFLASSRVTLKPDGNRISYQEAGIVGVNEWRPLKAEIPFGGVKRSGLGAEGGLEGIREFLDTQVVSMPKPILDS
jgi:acyl-CoA reductase-like NAD-dependent aldehyde dehydrogenase